MESSLRHGCNSGGRLVAATLAALPAGLPSKASAVTAIATQIAVMTKFQATVAGVVLAALAGAPFLIHQAKTISALREEARVQDAAQSRPRPGSGASGPGTEHGTNNDLRLRSLDDLRVLLADRPSRRNTAALWQQVEKLPPAELERLLLEAMQSAGSDWRDK